MELETTSRNGANIIPDEALFTRDDLKKIFNITNDSNFFDSIEKLKAPFSIQKKIKMKRTDIELWPLSSLPDIGKEFGFLKKLNSSKFISVFAEKGGVGKSSLALNLSRNYALNGFKTLVIDMDVQGDTGNNFGIFPGDLAFENIQAAIEHYDSYYNLHDFYEGEISLVDSIVDTSLPNLKLIPSNPSYNKLIRDLQVRNRKEYWALDKLKPEILKLGYDIVVFDLAPGWNDLTTNALVCSDLCVNPLGISMAHYRNHKIFEERVNEFKNQMGIRFNTCYIPMFYKSSKLSNQILDAYSKLNGYTDGTFIRHSIIGDEANARCLSYTEHDPNSKVAGDFREALMGVHESLSKTIH